MQNTAYRVFKCKCSIKAVILAKFTHQKSTSERGFNFIAKTRHHVIRSKRRGDPPAKRNSSYFYPACGSRHFRCRTPQPCRRRPLLRRPTATDGRVLILFSWAVTFSSTIALTLSVSLSSHSEDNSRRRVNVRLFEASSISSGSCC